jgi:hypothetical protein
MGCAVTRDDRRVWSHIITAEAGANCGAGRELDDGSFVIVKATDPALRR